MEVIVSERLELLKDPPNEKIAWLVASEGEVTEATHSSPKPPRFDLTGGQACFLR